jgi:hypothetical protein
MKASVMGVVQAHFRPEFINRLDDIVVFHPLDKAQIREIAKIQLRGLERRLAERGIRIELSDAALSLLGNVGFDPVYGARPLKRAIQAQVENPLATKILSGDFGNGDVVRVDAEGGTTGVPQRRLTVRPPAPSTPASPCGPCAGRADANRSVPHRRSCTGCRRSPTPRPRRAIDAVRAHEDRHASVPAASRRTPRRRMQSTRGTRRAPRHRLQ